MMIKAKRDMNYYKNKGARFQEMVDPEHVDVLIVGFVKEPSSYSPNGHHQGGDTYAIIIENGRFETRALGELTYED